jgi:TolB-like protein
MLCACGSRQVTVVDPAHGEHLSGNWNDGDSAAVAAQIVPDCLGAPWLEEFHTRFGHAPVVRLGHIRVRVEDLDDEIDTDVFTDDVQRALIDSGRVRAVASRSEANRREGARDARLEFEENARDAPEQRAELTADYLLAGSILMQNDSILDKGLISGTIKRLKFYQTTLTLTDLTSNEVVWSGSVDRKKLIEQSTVGR